ncbi:hypothetical protein NPIL_471031 [Nephila pilipes]|uniref:Uncharacterized protein n=1 Tax=Nephila pilipes TaxID=299642 RepID=A0A8X6QXP5_NEPPI|nr:hypothetical protein NPIL_471031 [Nephila pilipes]
MSRPFSTSPVVKSFSSTQVSILPIHKCIRLKLPKLNRLYPLLIRLEDSRQIKTVQQKMLYKNISLFPIGRTPKIDIKTSLHKPKVSVSAPSHEDEFHSWLTKDKIESPLILKPFKGRK